MGIDLTGLGLELPCIATLLVESRSSPSIDATLKDFTPAPTGEDCASEIRTEIHSASDNSDANLDGGTVYAGTTVHDVAFVTPTGPDSAPNATGTVTFHRYATIDCTGTAVDEEVDIEDQITGGIPVNTEGEINSSDFDTVAGQNLSYTAEYSGDETYAGAGPSACETLTVINPSTTLDKALAFSTLVTYTYTESNDGDDPLDPPTAGNLSSFVTDPDCAGTVTYQSGDDGNGVLDSGETFTFTCSETITTTGTHTNTAAGHGIDSLNRDVTVCTAGAGTPTPVPGPNNGQFCDPDETDSTSITITVDQGKP
jgi:hypothetical protein